MAQPVKSVQAEAAATATCVTSGNRPGCGDFKITVRAFGPALQAISKEIRKLDFLKSVANTLRSTEGDGRGKRDLSEETATYTPIQVEGTDANWKGDPLAPVPDPAFVYEPVITLDTEPVVMSPRPPPPPINTGGGVSGPIDTGPTAQTISDEDLHPGAIFAIILVLLLCVTPLLCYYYARTKYGADKACLWMSYKCSHSNPTLPFFYKPREAMEALRQQLFEPETSKASQGEPALARGPSQTAV